MGIPSELEVLEGIEQGAVTLFDSVDSERGRALVAHAFSRLMEADTTYRRVARERGLALVDAFRRCVDERTLTPGTIQEGWQFEDFGKVPMPEGVNPFDGVGESCRDPETLRVIARCVAESEKAAWCIQPSELDELLGPLPTGFESDFRGYRSRAVKITFPAGTVPHVPANPFSHRVSDREAMPALYGQDHLRNLAIVVMALAHDRARPSELRLIPIPSRMCAPEARVYQALRPTLYSDSMRPNRGEGYDRLYPKKDLANVAPSMLTVLEREIAIITDRSCSSSGPRARRADTLPPGDCAALDQIARRVRELAMAYPFVADAMRASIGAFGALMVRFTAAEEEHNWKELALARQVLEKGWLYDREFDREVLIPIRGAFPRACMVLLEKTSRCNLRAEDERACADGVFRLIRHREQVGSLGAVPPALDDEPLFGGVCWISAQAPPDWQAEPPDPRSLDTEDLRRFNEDDYLTIALFNLSGLADAGQARLIVPPIDEHDALYWRLRFPAPSHAADPSLAAPSPFALPPGIAQQMLEVVTRWIESRLEQTTAIPVAPIAVQPVVLWPGAAPTDRNIRLGRTRAAYEEAHGNVSEALRALKAQGTKIGCSTFYDHLAALDRELPGWRNRWLSGRAGIPENTANVRKHRNIRAAS
ncbi:MAG TPA: hypothetical protein VD971_03105 [Phycisphaerales bacterium]|nr:hypothetical protein [Phycisphaerales bacterium]